MTGTDTAQRSIVVERTGCSDLGPEYRVTVDGQFVDEVYRPRLRRIDGRYAYAQTSGWRQGRTKWCAGRIPDEYYDSRAEAVAEVVKRFAPVELGNYTAWNAPHDTKEGE